MYATHPYYGADNATRGATRHRFYDARMRRLERWKPERGTMLGIGCLEGGYALAVAASRGWRVVGVEPSEILANHAYTQLGIDVRVTEAWDLASLGGTQFDVIYTHSLEHVLDLRKMLRQCRQLLRPGGLFMVEVPNQFYSLKDMLKVTLFELIGTRMDRFFYREVNSEFHMYYFNPQTMRTLLMREQFQLLAFRTYLPFHPVYLANRRARWLQESMYVLGGLVERGPSMELLTQPKH